MADHQIHYERFAFINSLFLSVDQLMTEKPCWYDTSRSRAVTYGSSKTGVTLLDRLNYEFGKMTTYVWPTHAVVGLPLRRIVSDVTSGKITSLLADIYGWRGQVVITESDEPLRKPSPQLIIIATRDSRQYRTNVMRGGATLYGKTARDGVQTRHRRLVETILKGQLVPGGLEVMLTPTGLAIEANEVARAQARDGSLWKHTDALVKTALASFAGCPERQFEIFSGE